MGNNTEETARNNEKVLCVFDCFWIAESLKLDIIRMTFGPSAFGYMQYHLCLFDILNKRTKI
jgi:hypothetical protein